MQYATLWKLLFFNFRETFKYGTNIDDIVNPQEYDIKTKDGVHLYKQR